MVPPGDESTRRELASVADELLVGGWRVHLAGLHHLNVLAGDAPILSSSQAALEVTFPAALRIPAGPLALDGHRLNVTDAPIEALGVVELLEAAPGAPEAHGIALASSSGLRVAPGTTATLRYSAPAPERLAIVLITSHVHAHNRAIWATVGGVEVYRSSTWQDPAVAVFEPPLALEAGAVLEWACEIVNDSAVPLTFRNSVAEGEMCNLGGVAIARAPWVVAP